MTERFIIDDCGTLIDMTNRNTYDYVSDVVTLLNELHEENEQLKQAYTQLKHRHSLLHDVCIDAECDRDMYHKDVLSLEKENEQLKQQKPFLKIINDYFIQYEDGEFFNLHKPSDIRSLMYILNREHGYSELQCEYNDLEEDDVND